MTLPLVSCIVPVFNGERFLAEALDSIFQQNYRPLEIIVVDDGSTDGTAGIAAGYGTQIHYVQQANAGPAAARNRGLDIANGEFIAFLDADDLWHVEKLARQMARFVTRPELELCTTHIQNFWVPELKHEEEQLRDDPIAQKQPGPSQTLVATRTLFEKTGKFEAALLHRDTMDWITRAVDLGVVWELLPEVLVYRRIHTNNMSRKRSTADHDDLLQIVKASLERKRRLNTVQLPDTSTSKK